MKNLLILLLGLFCTATSAHAQTFTKSATIKEGPVLEERRASVSGLVGYNKDNFYIQKMVKGDLAISKVGTDLNESEVAEFDKMKYGELNQKLSNFVMVDGKIYLISSCVDKKNKTNIYLYNSLNTKTLQADQHAKKISEINYERSRDRGSFDYVVSRNESKVLIFSNDPEKKAEQENFHLQVFDSNMQLLWEKEDKLPYAGGLFGIEQYYVDNDGNVYIIGTEFAEKTVEKRKGKPNYKYHVLAYFNSGKEFKDFELSLEDKFITDLRFDILPSGEMVAAGFYSLKGGSGSAGTFYLSIDAATRKAKKVSVQDFSFDFVTETMNTGKKKRTGKREDKGKEAELFSYTIRDFYIKDNGGVVILAEQYYMTVVCSYNAQTRTQTCTYHYYYNDIIAVSVSAAGDIEWNTRIRKAQHTVNDGGYYSSFASAVVKDKIYLIFNDNPKNMLPDADLIKKLQRYGRGKEIAVAFVEIEQTGKHTREILFSQSKRGSVIIRPKICTQYDSDKMMLLGERRKEYQFFDITFEK